MASVKNPTHSPEKPVALSEFDPLNGVTRTYPPILPSVRRVVRMIAKGLYISYHRLEWAVWYAEAGDLSKLNKVAKTRVYEQAGLDLRKDGCDREFCRDAADALQSLLGKDND